MNRNKLYALIAEKLEGSEYARFEKMFDYRYELDSMRVVDLVESFLEGEEDTEIEASQEGANVDLSESVYEWADGMCNLYNAELLEGIPAFEEFLESAISGLGMPEELTFISLARMAQYEGYSQLGFEIEKLLNTIKFEL